MIVDLQKAFLVEWRMIVDQESKVRGAGEVLARHSPAVLEARTVQQLWLSVNEKITY